MRCDITILLLCSRQAVIVPPERGDTIMKRETVILKKLT